MKFDSSKYRFDDANTYAASILDGAVLYRITTKAFCSPDVVLNSQGPLKARGAGRWNVPQQTATYCSDNILVCIAEVLFHMYRGVLDKLEPSSSFPLNKVQQDCCLSRVLTIFSVREIDNLVQLSSSALDLDYPSARRIRGTLAVHPDKNYSRFNDLNSELRMGSNGKRGIVYPSARHSKGQCIVFFADETNSVFQNDYSALELNLRLISEEEYCKQLPKSSICPLALRVCGYAGYYEFPNDNEFQTAFANDLLNPGSIPQRGIVDFVRRNYANYPVDAVLAP